MPAGRRHSGRRPRPSRICPESSIGRLSLTGRFGSVRRTAAAAVADVAHPNWRGAAVGVYRLWRDSGYAFGAIFAGVLAERLCIASATASVDALVVVPTLVVWFRMPETLPARKC